MFLKNVSYLISAPSGQYYPSNELNEFLLLGKSNVGKSSLINKLCNSKVIAKVSSTPGHTKYLNFFNVDNAFRLVDSPGYGYARANRNQSQLFETMMSEYLQTRSNLKGAALLIDSKRVPDDDDLAVYNLLISSAIPFIVVATKCDRLNQSEKSKVVKNILSKFPSLPRSDIYISGRLYQKGYDDIITYIYKKVN